jgi:hypothetical protein
MALRKFGCSIMAPRRTSIAHLHRPWRATVLGDYDSYRYVRRCGLTQFCGASPAHFRMSTYATGHTGSLFEILCNACVYGLLHGIAAPAPHGNFDHH